MTISTQICTMKPSRVKKAVLGYYVMLLSLCFSALFSATVFAQDDDKTLIDTQASVELVSTQASEKNDEYAGIDITVNVNTASSEELATLLVGVGEKKAKAIVEYRGEHGGFKQADDLIQVKGIGPALVEKNKARLRF